MAPRAFRAAALLLSLSPAAAVQSKPRAGAVQAADSGSGARRVEEVLRSRTAQLRRALSDELGLEPDSDWTDAARELLAEEADYLSAEDDFAASLLHDFAKSPFVPLLGLDQEPPAQAPPAVDGGEEGQSQEVEETVVQQDEEGRIVKTTRRCHGRTCVTTSTTEAKADEPAQQAEVVEKLGAPDTEDSAVVASPEDVLDVVTSAADVVGDAMRVAARGLAKGLKQAAKASGLPPLGDILGKVMNGTALKDFAGKVMSSPAAKDLASTLSSGKLSNGTIDVVLSGENLTRALHDVMGAFNPAGGVNISSIFAPGSMLANAESVSTVTTVENGREVRRIRRCKQGQCTTTTEEPEN